MGDTDFDRYVTAELHLRRDTAHKLVRSYTFVLSAGTLVLLVGGERVGGCCPVRQRVEGDEPIIRSG